MAHATTDPRLSPANLKALAATYQQSLQIWMWVIAGVLLLIAIAALSDQSPSDYEPVSVGVGHLRRAMNSAKSSTQRSPRPPLAPPPKPKVAPAI